MSDQFEYHAPYFNFMYLKHFVIWMVKLFWLSKSLWPGQWDIVRWVGARVGKLWGVESRTNSPPTKLELEQGLSLIWEINLMNMLQFMNLTLLMHFLPWMFKLLQSLALVGNISASSIENWDWSYNQCETHPPAHPTPDKYIASTQEAEFWYAS